MTIEEIIKNRDRDTYKKLKRMSQKEVDKSREIKLGDSVENLMKHDSYTRQGGRIRQVKWG